MFSISKLSHKSATQHNHLNSSSMSTTTKRQLIRQHSNSSNAESDVDSHSSYQITDSMINKTNSSDHDHVSDNQTDSKLVNLSKRGSIQNNTNSIKRTIRNLKPDNSTVVIPYRNTKLTYLLKDHLKCQYKVILLVNVSSSADNINETMQTLKFSQHCKLQENIDDRI